MTKKNLFCSAILCAAIIPGSAMFAQGPVQNVNPQKHASLAAAQRSISEAYQKIDVAQGYHHDRLGGHGAKAKSLLSEAAQQLTLAAQYADQHGGATGGHGHK